jgi:hypothetical protein
MSSIAEMAASVKGGVDIYGSGYPGTRRPAVDRLEGRTEPGRLTWHPRQAIMVGNRVREASSL